MHTALKLCRQTHVTVAPSDSRISAPAGPLSDLLLPTLEEGLGQSLRRVLGHQPYALRARRQAGTSQRVLHLLEDTRPAQLHARNPLTFQILTQLRVFGPCEQLFWPLR